MPQRLFGELRSSHCSSEQAALSFARLSSPEYYVFTLYVADRSEDSLKIYERLAALCFRHLASKHVINLCDLAELGNGGGKYRVTTTPGVLGRMPEPLSRFIENLSFDEKYFLKVERAD